MLASKKGFFWRVLSLWVCLSLVAIYLRFGHASVLWACFFLRVSPCLADVPLCCGHASSCGGVSSWGYASALRACLLCGGLFLRVWACLVGVPLCCGHVPVLWVCLNNIMEQSSAPLFSGSSPRKCLCPLKKKNRGAECWSADEVICGTFFGLLEDASLWIAVINSLKSHLAFRKKTTALPWIIY